MGDNVRLEDALDVDVDTGLFADFPACRLAEGLSRFAFSAGVRPRRLAGVTDEENGIVAGDPDARTAGSPVLEPLEQGLVLGGGEFPRQFPDSELAVSRGVLDEDLVAPSPGPAGEFVHAVPCEAPEIRATNRGRSRRVG